MLVAHTQLSIVWCSVLFLQFEFFILWLWRYVCLLSLFIHTQPGRMETWWQWQTLDTADKDLRKEFVDPHLSNEME